MDRFEKNARRKIGLYERCYALEAEETPEEQRNSCSSHSDQLIFEALRLGGPMGTPSGGYPASVVGSIYDVVVNSVKPVSAREQEISQYLKEVREVKKRVGSGKSISPVFLIDRHEYRTVGILILDLIEGDGCELEGEGIHGFNTEELIYSGGTRILEPKKRLRMRRSTNLVKGFYWIEPATWKITQGLDSRIVYLQTFYPIDKVQSSLREFERKLGNENLTPNEEEYIQGNIEMSRKEVVRSNQVARIAGKERKYIFLNREGKVIDPIINN